MNPALRGRRKLSSFTIPDSGQAEDREAWVEALLTSLPLMSFDLVAARIHARLSARLAKSGEPVGAHDLMIAATALSRGLDVVTRDERSFPRISELSIVRW